MVRQGGGRMQTQTRKKSLPALPPLCILLLNLSRTVVLDVYHKSKNIPQV